jgi:hypothetical protein
MLVMAVAVGGGLKNAAKHMFHYQGNLGTFLNINAQNLYQSSRDCHQIDANPV